MISETTAEYVFRASDRCGSKPQFKYRKPQFKYRIGACREVCRLHARGPELITTR